MKKNVVIFFIIILVCSIFVVTFLQKSNSKKVFCKSNENIKNFTELTVSMSKCKNRLDLNPTFIDNKYIYSTTAYFDGKQMQNKIFMINKTTGELKEVYKFNDKDDSHIISYDVYGINNCIYWMEYTNRPENISTEWMILKKNLTTNKISIVDSGIAEDQLNPPSIQYKNDKLVWVDKKLINSKKDVESSIKYIDFKKSGNIKTIHSEQLTKVDKNNQKGIFIDNICLSNDKIISFEVLHNVGTEKKYRVLEYSFKKNEAVKILYENDFNYIIDTMTLTKDGNLVFSKAGTLFLYSAKDKKVLKQIDIGNETTYLTLIGLIDNERVLLRCDTNKIVVVNLKNEKINVIRECDDNSFSNPVIYDNKIVFSIVPFSETGDYKDQFITFYIYPVDSFDK